MQNLKMVRTGNLVLFPLLIVVATLLQSFTPAGITAGSTINAFYSDTATAPDGSEKITRNYSPRSFLSEKIEVYDSLRLNELGLSRKVFELALKGMSKLVKNNRVKENIISIIDFSQPSVNRRLYVIDLENYELLFNTWVAHGMRSGKTEARYFSNKMSSWKSSLGFYVTGNVYNGSNGYSLKLVGLERGINDYAMRRGIVMHGADYVNEEYIESQGYIGRSRGCPAVAPEVCQPLIDQVKEGTCLFIYHPSSSYRSLSKMLK